MPLKTVVKVSHLSNLSDARYCSGMGVELLGFRVIPGSPRFMPPAVFQEIRGWVSGPKIVAELYGLTSSSQIAEAIQTYAPDYLELSLEEYNNFRDDLTLPAIVDIEGPEAAQTIAADENIAYLMVGENSSCRDVSSTRFRMLINIRSEASLQKAISEGCFAGYVLEGPDEVRPGVTNYDQLGMILEALEDND